MNNITDYGNGIVDARTDLQKGIDFLNQKPVAVYGIPPKIKMDVEKEMNILILLGIAKLFSEQSTFLIGELRHENKQRFNTAVTAVDSFMKVVEGGLNEHNRGTLQILVDALNDGVGDLRKTLMEAK